VRFAEVATTVLAAHRAGPEDVPELVMRLAPALGATELVIYLVDYEQVTLRPCAGTAVPDRAPVTIDATVAGRAYTTGQLVEVPAGTGRRVWVPFVDGRDRRGVLEVVAPAPAYDPAPEEYETVAALVAGIVAARWAYGDTFERTRRRLPMQLPAEILWNVLPPLTFASKAAAVSAILEPCYEVGGDAFDHAMDGDVLHVAMFDVVGHGIAASALTSLAISAYRNARRCGLDLVDTYRSIDKWVHAQYPEGFATALLAELDTGTGEYARISAGHPGEILLRDGRVVAELPAPTALPLGLGYLGDPMPRIEREALQPGDRLLLYTDGVIEARTEEGDFFGFERLADFIARAVADGLPAPETMRRLVQAILAHQHERLQDDASAALVEWRPA